MAEKLSGGASRKILLSVILVALVSCGALLLFRYLWRSTPVNEAGKNIKVLLGNRRAVNRLQAARAMTGVEFAERTVPALAEALVNDTSWHVRKACAMSLLRIANKDSYSVRPAIPALCKALEDDYSDVRAFTAMVLDAMGPLARDAIPALEKAIQVETDRHNKSAFTEALGRIQRAVKGTRD